MERPEKKPWRRSRSERVIGGVCGGLAARSGWSPWLVRGIFITATVIPVLPGLPLYVLLWALVPRESDPQTSTTTSVNGREEQSSTTPCSGSATV